MRAYHNAPGLKALETPTKELIALGVYKSVTKPIANRFEVQPCHSHIARPEDDRSVIDFLQSTQGFMGVPIPLERGKPP